MCMRVLPVCMYQHHTCACCQRDQKRVSDPLEVDLQTVVSRHMDAENQMSPLQEPRVPLAAALSSVPGFSRSDTRFEIGAEDL